MSGCSTRCRKVHPTAVASQQPHDLMHEQAPSSHALVRHALPREGSFPGCAGTRFVRPPYRTPPPISAMAGRIIDRQVIRGKAGIK